MKNFPRHKLAGQLKRNDSGKNNYSPMKNLFSIFVLFIIVSCHHSKILSEKSDLPFDKEGHRGCRGLMPENTIPAMLHALDIGVTTLEMDAVITKDNKVILSHEPFFNHDITTRPDGSFIDQKDEKNYNIYKMTFVETQQYDVGLKPNPRFSRQQKLPKPSACSCAAKFLIF